MDKKSIIAINKSDLLTGSHKPEIQLGTYAKNALRISAKTGDGLDHLKNKLIETSIVGSRQQGPAGPFAENNGAVVTNLRHKIAIDNAMNSLDTASKGLQSSLPLEVIAVEVRDALDRLGEIVGAVTTEDILNRIFSEFCIGK